MTKNTDGAAWVCTHPKCLNTASVCTGDCSRRTYIAVSAPQEPARSAIRQFLIDYWEGDGDNSMAHAVISAPSDFEAVRRTVESFVVQERWLQEQCNERAELIDRIRRLEADLESAKQPLSREMALLNKRVIELNAENARLRGVTP